MSVGFVTISHPDYVGGTVSEVIQKSTDALREAGIELCCPDIQVDTDKKARLAARHCLDAGVDGVVLFMSTWTECPVITSVLREVEHLPILLWGFPMVETANGPASTGSYVTYAMYKGVLDRIGHPYKGVLGSAAEPEVIGSVKSFAQAAAASRRLRRSKVGLLGYTSMGIYTGTFDHVLMRFRIGPEVEHIDAYTYFGKVGRVDAARTQRAAQLLRATARVAGDVSEGDVETIARMYEGIMELKAERGLDAINVKCQYEFSKEFGMVACVPLALAADSGIVAACEGDTLNTVSMMMLHLLCGQAVTYGDALNHEDGALLLSSCGFSPFSMSADTPPCIRPFVPGRGFSGVMNSFVLRPGPVTVMRLVEDIGSYHILYFIGDGLESDLREGYFPALRVRPQNGMEGLVRHYSGQHYALCYGDYSQQVEDLARILRIGTIRV